jgi:hypothetical protein
LTKCSQIWISTIGKISAFDLLNIIEQFIYTKGEFEIMHSYKIQNSESTKIQK